MLYKIYNNLIIGFFGPQVSIPSTGKGHSTGLVPGPLRPTRDALGAPVALESPVETTYTFTRHAIRSNYMDKSIEAKKNVS